MMWMMGYNDGGDFNSIQDPFAGRGKLRPLIPRPATAAAVATSPPCLTRIHGTDLLALNHHLAMVEQNKRELNTQQVVVSSRWNPTPEQLQTLEELYRRGTRTPSAEQIQQITTQLRRYGKIEGKNVFYWFQNHKARERQKRRRQHDEQQQQPHYVNGDKREAPGANRTVFEVEQTKNWASPTNSSTVLAERGICTQGGAAAAAAGARAAAEASECKADGWVHFDEEEDDDTDMLLQHRRNATWQSMHLSSCSSSSSPTNLVNTSSAPPTVANCATIIPSTFGTILETSKPPHQDHLINIFFKPYTSQSFEDHAVVTAAAGEEAQTLQLFPLQSGRGRHRQWGDEEDEEEEEEEEEEGSDVGMSTNSCHAPPYQFFEFLPLKN